MESNRKVISKRIRRLIAGILLILAVTMIVYGMSRGEVSIVWNKAINVCLECIGLG
jgi:hypothetical protein